ncbi:hypothetical protein ASC80_03665 [Afipia sp. Root123D2]|uniref:hypothetical protein n=1 Tax=Afipia sp. Root123D2 TaxID=1736436 RepID=UPI0007008512|nr:hypothetical protein [Afipia sp. Root123D2]KQW22493.1 hypothetical protein ASC80_03665 [Afipia sp. Root123D2]
MRRKSTGPKDASNAFNILTDISPERLQKFAAIVIVWNYIETFLDASLGLALRIDVQMFPHVSSRINGTDGKIAIIKESILLAQPKEHTRVLLSKTLNAVQAYKKNRDGVVHVKISDPSADVADTIQRQGIADEVLISQAALDAIFARLSLVGLEMNQLFKVLHHCAMGDLTNDVAEKKRHAELAEQALAQLQSFQTEREALPPPPKFPDELPEPLSSEGDQALPG